MRNKISILMFTMLLGGCLTDDETPSKEIKGNTFHQNDLDFSLELPGDWTNKLNDEVSGQKAEVTSKNALQENFAANIVVMATPTSGMTSMTQIISWYKTQTSMAFPGVEFLVDTVLVVDGVEVGKVVYQGDLFGSSLKFKELLFIRNGMDVQAVFTDLKKYFDTREEFVISEKTLKFF